MFSRRRFGRLNKFDDFEDHQPFDPRFGSFVVVDAGAVIADLRIGEDDDLAGIGGIGEDFLVAGQRGMEDHFARAHQNSGP